MRRRALLAASALLALPAAARAQAQSWPGRPVTLVVPFGAGGNVDALARVIAPGLSARLGQPVVVENVPGAGGVLGVERVARAAPDGHALVMGVEGPISIMPSLSPGTLRFDPERDLVPVALVASLPLVLIGRPDLPAADLAALLALGRDAPGGLTLATSGTGTILHLFAALLAQRSGAKLEHVPYRVAAQIPADLVSGRLDLAVLTVTSAAPLLREGRVKGYAVSGPTAIPGLPGVPPAAALPALRGIAMEGWQALFAPARTPPEWVAHIGAAVADLLAEPAVRDKLDNLGMTPGALPREALPGFLAAEAARYAAIIRDGNIRLD
ncbi:Bug family tripartite tricarboxylate transporter substrate binding protein [Dankookia rubra]|uniref:Bug family tripartite tricarboxylate transporter substrate binding protein n=1 Tax=Dankookia rubra TaxID=1442381 RepID=UPI00140C4783|nr:tripartite tricarboxylate transporter substrate binding protein [Dankookia rubra]